MKQMSTPALHEILLVLYDGGRIDQFANGNVFLTNIFGELLAFDTSLFDLLLDGQLILIVHLHLPGGSCYKISPSGIDLIHQRQLEQLCPLPESARQA
jgi:hypothetical protein